MTVIPSILVLIKFIYLLVSAFYSAHVFSLLLNKMSFLFLAKKIIKKYSHRKGSIATPKKIIYLFCNTTRIIKKDLGDIFTIHPFQNVFRLCNRR